ncbi:MAG: hypothetical protein MJZ38_07690 [archaeon]|nr:hypothetical protein [archaeon]
MRASTVVALVAAGAVMIGTLMVCASGVLLDELHPDPCEHSGTYSLEGVLLSEQSSGEGRVVTLHENASHHNYRFECHLDSIGGSTRSFSFHVIFGPDGMPVDLEETGRISVDGVELVRYEGMSGGGTISLQVADHCLVRSFTFSDGTVDCRGVLIEG